MEYVANKPCRHVCNQIPQNTAHARLIIAIKSEVKISTFHEGKIIQTKVAYFSKIQNHIKFQDPKLLLPPQKMVQKPSLRARNVLCDDIQWHDTYLYQQFLGKCRLQTNYSAATCLVV